jgi:hypothetical protein
MGTKEFGSWKVTNKGIEWAGTPPVEYVIDKDRLGETAVWGGTKIYDWPVHMVQKTWLQRKDINDLTQALRFAAEHFGVPLSDDIWEASLQKQEAELQARGK